MNKVVERLLNLLAFLLTVGRPVTMDEIRRTVAGYDRDADEAFRRMFERDKELLRAMGVPLELRPTDAWEVEHGYVIPAEDYELEDPGFTDEERAALWLAAQVVRLGGRPTGPEGLLKLGGAPVTGAGEPLAADLGVGVDDLAVAFRAIADRRILEFEYRGRSRSVQPLALIHRRGHWYLMAVERGQERAYRVDRGSGYRAGDKEARLQAARRDSTQSPPSPRCLGRRGPMSPRRRSSASTPTSPGGRSASSRWSGAPARRRLAGGDARVSPTGIPWSAG